MSAEGTGRTPRNAGRLDGFGALLGDKRLLFVTGKGGAGKSTVAAALGLAAARRGLHTIVVELSGQSRVPALLGGRGAGMREVRLRANLTATSIDPRQALREYLRHQLGPLGDVLMASRVFAYVAAAAPGLSELVTIGKVWELAQTRRQIRGASSYDLVIVDAPSSGQFLALARAPATFAQIARTGPVGRQARAIAATLHDADRTGVLIVTLAEELAVAETSMLRADLARATGMMVDGVLANRVYPRRFDDGDVRLVTRELGRTQEALHEAALRAALSEHGRRRRQEAQLARLARECGEPALELPLMGEVDVQALEALGERLVGGKR